MSFDGIPFSVEEERVMDCQHGQKYYKKSHTSAQKRLRLQGTRKIGCQAKIHIKKYTLYPEFAVSQVQKSKRALKSSMQQKIEELQENIYKEPEKIKRAYRYLVSLPTQEAHHGHPTGEQAGFVQRVHPGIIAKIKELVSVGVTNVMEIKRCLRLHVKEVISKQLEITPDYTNRSLFPTDNDISNHVHLAKRALAFSKLDQENLNQHLKQWQKNGNGHNAFFRPYVSKTTPSSSENISDEQEFEQTLLLVLQEEWQKHILERYGNTISLIDATYKTTQYDLPLFFICVRTNVGYMVVAEFVVQSEQSDKIREAIEIIKQWNPNWNPAYFMCDYSEAELLALESCFPSVKLYLCDFHREQAWERWTKKSLSKEDGEILLSGYATALELLHHVKTRNMRRITFITRLLTNSKNHQCGRIVQ